MFHYTAILTSIHCKHNVWSKTNIVSGKNLYNPVVFTMWGLLSVLPSCDTDLFVPTSVLHMSQSHRNSTDKALIQKYHIRKVLYLQILCYTINLNIWSKFRFWIKTWSYKSPFLVSLRLCEFEVMKQRLVPAKFCARREGGQATSGITNCWTSINTFNYWTPWS